MCFEISSLLSFPPHFSIFLAFLFSSICRTIISLQREEPNIYKRHNLLAFKRLFFHSAQKVQALRSSCISLVTDDVLMWGSKIYLQYVLVWYYLLGDQNSLGCILFLVMFTEHLLLPALSFPSGRKGCKLFSPQLASPERALNISAHGKWERRKPQEICQPYASWTYGYSLL